MKPLRNLAVALALVIVASVAATRPAEAAVSFDFFYSNLSHHGSWLVSGSYGRVWQPSVYRTGWNPYYDGRWEYTDAGWCWDSEYEWGDIPYHYGTWVMDASYGWVWVPGYTWAPSWVEFREGPDYIGWAPVAPSFSIGVSFGHSWSYRPDSFVFVRSHDFLCDRVRGYAVPRHETNIIINRTKIINNNIRIENNIVVNRGPDVRFVERATRRHVNAVSIDRVPGVRRLEARGVSREDIRVSSRADRRAIRAAEPVPADRSVRGSGRDFDRNQGSHDFRNRDDAYQGRNDFRNRDSARSSNDFRGRDRGGELGTPSARMPESQRPRDEVRRGRDRQEAGPNSDAFRRGRMESPRDRRSYSDRPSVDSRQERSMREERDRSDSSYRDRQRSSARPDEGRMFRSMRERQSAPHMDRPSAQGERMSDRSSPRERMNGDRSRQRSSERTQRSTERRQKSERPKKSDSDRNH